MYDIQHALGQRPGELPDQRPAQNEDHVGTTPCAMKQARTGPAARLCTACSEGWSAPPRPAPLSTESPARIIESTRPKVVRGDPFPARRTTFNCIVNCIDTTDSLDEGAERG